MKKFQRVYVEVTNVCGLECDFCPPKILPNKTMSLEEFERVIQEVSLVTKEITLHIVGDPLILPNLQDYLEVVKKYGLRVFLVSSGFYLKKHQQETLFRDEIKQISISLNSYNKNEMKISLEEYMKPVVDLCKYKLEKSKSQFINLRLWNIDSIDDREFNQEVFTILQRAFACDIDSEKLYKERVKSFRIENKILLVFDEYFSWPTLSSDRSFNGVCQGLDSHFGVLADLQVVPCCLDKDGVVSLGSLKLSSLQDILDSPRVTNIVEGFRKKEAVEVLCKKCTYKERFNQ